MKESPNWDKVVIEHHANKIVEEREDIHRMERCGCPSCLKAVQSLEELHLYEIGQILNPPEVDHEEVIITNIALGKLRGDI